MWRHGRINLNGQIIDTSWKVMGGTVIKVNLPHECGLDAMISIDGRDYAVDNLSFEAVGAWKTVPLITADVMRSRIAEIEAAKAKALADFEGRTMGQDAVDGPQEQASPASGKKRTANDK